MGLAIEDLEVAIFDWPDRFLVEAEESDREWEKVFGIPDTDPNAPYLVDLSELEEGWCGCRDFTFNVIPLMHENPHRSSCKHIIAATRYVLRLGTKPKQMPDTINL